MSFEDRYKAKYKAKSIWGEGGPDWAKEDGIKEAIRAKGEPLANAGVHTDMFKEGYAEGVQQIKQDKLEKVLTGKLTEAEMADIDIDKLFDRAKETISPGGIILPPSK